MAECSGAGCGASWLSGAPSVVISSEVLGGAASSRTLIMRLIEGLLSYKLKSIIKQIHDYYDSG